jgi:hypothetical protein
MLITSGNITLAVVLCVHMTSVMQGIKVGAKLLDARESPKSTFLHISAFGEMESNLTI